MFGRRMTSAGMSSVRASAGKETQAHGQVYTCASLLVQKIGGMFAILEIYSCRDFFFIHVIRAGSTALLDWSTDVHVRRVCSISLSCLDSEHPLSTMLTR